MKRTGIQTLAALVVFFTLATTAIAADIAVIVNKNNTNDVARDLVVKIYKGDQTVWAGGGSIVAFDQQEASDIRATFTQQLLGKTVAGMKAVWSVKLFSGKATPPKAMSSDEEVRSAVAANKNAIGYIQASSVDGSVKAVLTIR